MTAVAEEHAHSRGGTGRSRGDRLDHFGASCSSRLGRVVLTCQYRRVSVDCCIVSGLGNKQALSLSLWHPGVCILIS